MSTSFSTHDPRLPPAGLTQPAPLTFTVAEPGLPDGDAAVVFTSAAGGVVSVLPGATPLDDALGGRLLDALRTLGATGRDGDVVRLATLGQTKCPLVVAVGTGDAADVDADALRRAAGNASRSVGERADVAIAVPELDSLSAIDVVTAIVVGWRLGAYRFDRYRTSAASAGPTRVRLAAAGDADDSDVLDAAAARGGIIADAVALCRDLINAPARDVTPGAMADVAAALAVEHDLAIGVLDEHALRAGGYGGLVAVGQGSVNPPRLVRMGYGGRPGAPTVAVVGKGITFDSGGLSLKGRDSMWSMKADMAGAAAALAVVVAAARLQLDCGVTAWLPLAENMPDGAAIRPSDVLMTHSGRTVEVVDTDAEGRLVLADALSRACAESPAAVVDVATLTGSHVPAVGTDYAAVLSNDDRLRDVLVAAGAETGEPLLPLPLAESLRGSLDSRVADLRNVGDGDRGKVVVSALFLREFVAPGIPWAHLDIVGPSSNHGEPTGYRTKGATGVTVRLLLQAIEKLGR